MQGLDKFSKGYETMGFQVANDDTITYREWAPAADAAWLIGDFSKQPCRNGLDYYATLC